MSALNLLIVDDEVSILNSLKFLFEKRYKVTTANSAEEALALIDNGYEVQLILSDENMPGMSGHELLKIIHDRFPIARCNIITGYSDMESLINAINVGNLQGYISKPWDNNELRLLLAKAEKEYEIYFENIQLNEKLRQINQELEEKSKEEIYQLNQKLENQIDELNKSNQEMEDALKIQHDISDNLIRTSLELKEAEAKVEEQNIALSGSFYSLQELHNTKTQLLSKLGTLHQTHLTPLKNELLELSKPPISLEKRYLQAGLSKIEQIESILGEVLSLQQEEQAVQQKRVLLADDNKHQQIVAKMALGGTGVELDIVNSYEEGVEFLEKPYDLICVTTEMIELAKLAHERYSNIQSVLMTYYEPQVYLPVVKKHPYLTNIVARSKEDRTFNLKNIHVTVSKLISNDLFGLEKYLSWGTKIQQRTVTNSQQRTNLIEEMNHYFSQLGVRRQVRMKCGLVAEEQLMNAIYDAPTNAQGEALYNHLPRTEPVELKREEQAIFRFACDGMFLGVSVEDPFGRFERKTLLAYLESCYTGQAGSLNNRKGGAGRGLYLMFETADLFVVNVKPKVKTEVIAIINIDPSNASSKKVHSLQFFYG